MDAGGADSWIPGLLDFLGRGVGCSLLSRQSGAVEMIFVNFVRSSGYSCLILFHFTPFDFVSFNFTRKWKPIAGSVLWPAFQ